MKQIFAWLFAAIFFAAGCAHSPELAEPVRGTGYEDADGLVIVAACPPATRTDIEEGKSTWEAGDRITVVYDGAAYEYTAAEAGPTTAFTSEAGIADYDASKPLTAYYPATTAEGVVSVEAERTIALDAESQSNPARAPLVGLPTSGNLAEGALEVTFRNIFSVIELRIDAGELASAAQSLTVELADEAAFEGFLSFEGTVDPETLALTPAENGTGNSLIFNFAEGVDLTKPQTIKFPVGRFRSEAGLRLTLGTADGKSYSKNIYKTGITSYAEQGGVFRAKHMAKALYAFAPQGGISTADDLIEFAAAVNAGETLAPWQDDKGVVVLLDDIDLAEVTEWTPIGAATSKLESNALSITSGRPFTGYFDGQGHTIRNLKMVCKAAQATSAWGFFGAVANGAVVENLIFDASCSLEDKATAGTDCGVVAGLVYEATVRNVVNKAPISFDGAAPDETRMTIGMVGLAFADKNGARLEKLVNHGALTATSGGNTKNGATGIHVGGIVGFSSNKSNTMAVVTIAECANYGDLDTQVARASGIVAAANRYTEIENCVNEGDNVNAFATVNSARIGNITCITAVGSKITNTVNRGNVICKTSGAAGGIVGDTGAQQIKLPLLLVLADQVGQQRLHRAALHRGDRQIRRRHQQHVVIPQAVVPRNVRAHALPAVGAAGPEKFLPQHPVHLAQPALPGAGRDTAARAQLFGSLHRFSYRHKKPPFAFSKKARQKRPSPPFLPGRVVLFYWAAVSAAAMRAAVYSSCCWLCSSTSATSGGTSTSTPRRIL